MNPQSHTFFEVLHKIHANIYVNALKVCEMLLYIIFIPCPLYNRIYVRGWIVSPQNSYVAILNLSILVFGDGCSLKNELK